MKTIVMTVLLVIILSGPLPPLLPSRPGPATRAGARVRCSVTISPSAWPAQCPPTWRMR